MSTSSDVSSVNENSSQVIRFRRQNKCHASDKLLYIFSQSILLIFHVAYNQRQGRHCGWREQDQGSGIRENRSIAITFQEMEAICCRVLGNGTEAGNTPAAVYRHPRRYWVVHKLCVLGNNSFSKTGTCVYWNIRVVEINTLLNLRVSICNTTIVHLHFIYHATVNHY